MKIAVITIVSGRHTHLFRQQRGLALSSVRPDDYVVVAMDDPDLADWRPAATPAPSVIDLRAGFTELPLAAARNAGARGASDADLLVFLDVDCIPSPAMIETYARAAERSPSALLSGAVGYLPEGSTGESDDAARFPSFRPRLPAGELAIADPRLFWSLSFACTPTTWSRIGGFDESYRGYGAEDTDFGMRAHRAGVEFLWVGGAEAFHQFHPTNSPPTQHLDDILRNGRLFADRWGFWPMEGWLREFAELGLVTRNPTTGDWASARVLS